MNRSSGSGSSSDMIIIRPKKKFGDQYGKKKRNLTLQHAMNKQRRTSAAVATSEAEEQQRKADQEHVLDKTSLPVVCKTPFIVVLEEMISKLPAEVQGGAAGQLQVGAQSTQGIAASRAPPYTIDRGFETSYTTRALPLLARAPNQWASFPLDPEGRCWCRCAEKHRSYVKKHREHSMHSLCMRTSVQQ